MIKKNLIKVSLVIGVSAMILAGCGSKSKETETSTKEVLATEMATEVTTEKPTEKPTEFDDDKVQVSTENESASTFESHVEPNFVEYVNADGDKVVSTTGSSVSIKDNSDKRQIKVLITDVYTGEVTVKTIGELIEDNEITDDNNFVDINESDPSSYIGLAQPDPLGGMEEAYVPKDAAYDTDLVLRSSSNFEDYYIGALYGKYLYKMEKAEHDYFNIDKYKVILSYSDELVLGESEERDAEVTMYYGTLYYHYYE